MIKGIKVLILLLLVSWGNAFSQQLSHQVLVSVAGIASTNSINYSQTIGETAVEIIGCSEYTFTQGFQQPCIRFSKENPPPGNGVRVYPNPVSDFVNVELFGDASRAFRIDIINISGTIIRSEKIDFTGPYWHVQQLAFEQLSRGFYFIRIVSDDGLIGRTFKIDKM